MGIKNETEKEHLDRNLKNLEETIKKIIQIVFVQWLVKLNSVH